MQSRKPMERTRGGFPLIKRLGAMPNAIHVIALEWRNEDSEDIRVMKDEEDRSAPNSKPQARNAAAR